MLSSHFPGDVVQSFANRVRRARLHAQLTQSELADKVGVQRGAVAQWEHDEGSKPGLTNLIEVALATHVSFEWLATGRGSMKSGDAHHGQAHPMSDFAHNEIESRLLVAIRRMRNPRKRQVIVDLVEGLTR